MVSDESLHDRLARYTGEVPARTRPRSSQADVDRDLDPVKRCGAAAREALLRELEVIEESKRSQPQRLVEMRAQAEDERIKALMDEPWADFVTGIPTVTGDGERTSDAVAMPTIVGKELFGTRLAFDLLAHCGDEERVAEILRTYYKMTGGPRHMFLVCAAALDTIAIHVIPALLDTLEHQASDYDARVRLAEAARNAWAARVVDLKKFAEDGE
jgi:hypothetical protein